MCFVGTRWQRLYRQERCWHRRQRLLNNNAKVIIIAIILTVVLALIVQSCATSISGTVKEFAPVPQATAEIALDRRVQEAQVTATYISVLASEVVSDTQNTHAVLRQREVDRYNRERVIADAWTGVQVGLMACLVFVAGFKSLEVVRASLRPIPQRTRSLAYRPQLTAGGMVSDPNTLATWEIDTPRSPDEVHGGILERQRAAIPAEIVRNLADVARIRQSAGMPLRAVDRRFLELDSGQT